MVVVCLRFGICEPAIVEVAGGEGVDDECRHDERAEECGELAGAGDAWEIALRFGVGKCRAPGGEEVGGDYQALDDHHGAEIREHECGGDGQGGVAEDQRDADGAALLVLGGEDAGGEGSEADEEARGVREEERPIEMGRGLPESPTAQTMKRRSGMSVKAE